MHELHRPYPDAFQHHESRPVTLARAGSDSAEITIAAASNPSSRNCAPSCPSSASGGTSCSSVTTIDSTLTLRSATPCGCSTAGTNPPRSPAPGRIEPAAGCRQASPLESGPGDERSAGTQARTRVSFVRSRSNRRSQSAAPTTILAPVGDDRKFAAGGEPVRPPVLGRTDRSSPRHQLWRTRHCLLGHQCAPPNAVEILPGCQMSLGGLFQGNQTR
jgi:hypothetical protein